MPGKMDPNFQNKVKYILETLLEIKKGLQGEDQRPWIDFRDQGDPKRFDFDSIHECFTREGAEQDYIKARVDKEGKAGEVVAAKLQSDWLAGLERDFRMRHRTRIRMLAHQSCRMEGYGDNNGPLYKNTVGWVERIMKAE